MLPLFWSRKSHVKDVHLGTSSWTTHISGCSVTSNWSEPTENIQLKWNHRKHANHKILNLLTQIVSGLNSYTAKLFQPILIVIWWEGETSNWNIKTNFLKGTKNTKFTGSLVSMCTSQELVQVHADMEIGNFVINEYLYGEHAILWILSALTLFNSWCCSWYTTMATAALKSNRSKPNMVWKTELYRTH